MDQPAVSIVVANYNQSHFLPEMLQSLLNQSYQASEIIVVDDGSTDNSVEILERFAKEHSTVRFFKNGHNRGAEYSYNRGLELAKGNYISLLSADDVYLPGFLEKSASLLREYPQAGLCCSDPGYIDGLSGMCYSRSLGLSNRPCYFSPDELVELMRRKYVEVGGTQSLIRRSAFLEAGGYLSELKWHCDWFVLLVIAFRCGICYVPEPLVTKRVTLNSYSAAGSKHWPSQYGVLSYMLSAIKSPSYADVYNKFKRSGILSQLPKILYILLGTRKHWGYLTPLLLWRAICSEIKSKINLITPAAVKRIYNGVRFKWVGKATSA